MAYAVVYLHVNKDFHSLTYHVVNCWTKHINVYLRMVLCEYHCFFNMKHLTPAKNILCFKLSLIYTLLTVHRDDDANVCSGWQVFEKIHHFLRIIALTSYILAIFMMNLLRNCSTCHLFFGWNTLYCICHFLCKRGNHYMSLGI